MASSWFKGLSSILSRRNNKRVKHQPLKSFYKDLYLENLEDRLTPSSASWDGSTLTVWFDGGDAGASFTQSNGATGNSLIYTISTTGLAWVNDNPSIAGPQPTLPTGVSGVGTQDLIIDTNDATLSSLSRITVQSVRGGTNTINFGTPSLSVNASKLGGSLNIDLVVDPSFTGSNAFQVVFQSRVQTKGNGALTINAGSATNSTITLNPNLNSSATYGDNASLLTTGLEGITLLATNNSNSFVNLGAGNVIQTSADTGGNILFQGGTNAGLGKAVILRADNSVLTVGGSITFQGSNSSTLIDASTGTPAVLQSKAGGNISIAGFLDNFTTGVPSDLTFITSGNISVGAAVGLYQGRVGELVIGNPFSSTANDVTFSSSINAERLALNNAAAAIRGNVLISGDQNYNNNVTNSNSALYLQTVTGKAQSIVFNGKVTADTTTGLPIDASIILNGGTNANLTLSNNVDTAGELIITSMKDITLGNAVSNSSIQSALNPFVIAAISPVILGGNVTLLSTSNQSISALSSITGQGKNLTVSTGGDIILASLGDAGSSLGFVSIPSASKSLTINGAQVNVAGLSTATLVGPIDISVPVNQTYNGDLTLTTSGGSISTGNMKFASTGNVTLNATNPSTGQINLKGSITDILNSFNQINATKVVVGTSTSGAIVFSNKNGSATGFVFNSPVELAESLTINGSTGTPVTFMSNINNSQASAVRPLTVNTINANITFKGNIGSDNTLGAILGLTVKTTGSGIVIFDALVTDIKTSGAISVTGPALISNATTKINAGSISFVGDLSSASGTNVNLKLTTTGALSFGSIGQSATGGTTTQLGTITLLGTPTSFTSGAINAISLSTSGSVTISGNVNITGTQNYTAGNLDLASTGSITMADVVIVGDIILDNNPGAGDISFGGINASGNVSFDHGGNLIFKGANFPP